MRVPTEIPTIELSTTDNLGQSNNSFSRADVVAISEMEEGVGSGGDHPSSYSPSAIHEPQFHNGRAEFVSATVVKPTRTTDVGIGLKLEHPIIADLVGNSLVSGSPLRVGDRLHSINHQRVKHLDSPQILQLLNEAEASVTIVAQNDGGDATLVETMIPKLSNSLSLEFGIKFEYHHDSLFGNNIGFNQSCLRVASIAPNGLFSNSLLTVGDEIISINQIPCHEITPSAAMDILSSSQQQNITVVAKTGHETAAVIAELHEMDSVVNLREEEEEEEEEDPGSTRKTMISCGSFSVLLALSLAWLVYESKN